MVYAHYTFKRFQTMFCKHEYVMYLCVCAKCCRVLSPTTGQSGKSTLMIMQHILTETQKPEKYTTASVSTAFCEMWSVNYIKHN